MATSLEQLLAGSYGGTDSYLKKSPWAQAGAQIMQIETPAPQTNAQAFSIPFIQGLLGGGLMGYGKKQATQQAFEDYSKNPLLKGTYASGEMPEGWSADTGRTDLLQGLVRAEAEKKAAAETAKQAAAMEKFLMGKSLRATPTGGVEVDPEMLAANNQILEAKERIKGQFNPSGTKIDMGISAPLATEIGKSMDLVDRGEQVISKIEKEKPTWVELQGSSLFATLDKTGARRDIDDLTERLVNSVTGAAAPEAQMKRLKAIVAGDATMTGKEVVRTLKYFIDAEKRMINTQMRVANEIKAGTLKPYELGGAASSLQVDPSVPPGHRLERNKVTGKTRVVKDG